MFQKQIVILFCLFCHFCTSLASVKKFDNVSNGSTVLRKRSYYPEEQKASSLNEDKVTPSNSASTYSSGGAVKKQHKSSNGALEKIKNSLYEFYGGGSNGGSGSNSNLDMQRFKRSQFIHAHDGGLSNNVGSAIGVAGLGLLFINTVASALHIPFLLPILMIPLTLLVVATLISPQKDNNNGGGGGGGGFRK